MLLYFLFGYLFYASLMTGIGAIDAATCARRSRCAGLFTIAELHARSPCMMKILNTPELAVADRGLSLFPPTAAPTT